jgi:hypothetical protein
VIGEVAPGTFDGGARWDEREHEWLRGSTGYYGGMDLGHRYE